MAGLPNGALACAYFDPLAIVLSFHLIRVAVSGVVSRVNLWVRVCVCVIVFSGCGCKYRQCFDGPCSNSRCVFALFFRTLLFVEKGHFYWVWFLVLLLRLLSSASYGFAGESLALLNTTLLRIDDSLSLLIAALVCWYWWYSDLFCSVVDTLKELNIKFWVWAIVKRGIFSIRLFLFLFFLLRKVSSRLTNQGSFRRFVYYWFELMEWFSFFFFIYFDRIYTFGLFWTRRTRFHLKSYFKKVSSIKVIYSLSVWVCFKRILLAALSILIYL